MPIKTIPKDKIPIHLLKKLKWFRNEKPLENHVSPNPFVPCTYTKDYLKSGENLNINF